MIGEWEGDIKDGGEYGIIFAQYNFYWNRKTLHRGTEA